MIGLINVIIFIMCLSSKFSCLSSKFSKFIIFFFFVGIFKTQALLLPLTNAWHKITHGDSGGTHGTTQRNTTQGSLKVASPQKNRECPKKQKQKATKQG